MPSQDERLALAFANIDTQFQALNRKLDKLQQTVDDIKKRLAEIQREGLPRGR
jgi:prefoldin subunit 5